MKLLGLSTLIGIVTKPSLTVALSLGSASERLTVSWHTDFFQQPASNNILYISYDYQFYVHFEFLREEKTNLHVLCYLAHAHDNKSVEFAALAFSLSSFPG